jgi:hypothetical protein
LKNKRIPKEFLGAFKAGHRLDARSFIDDEFAHGLLALVKAGNDEAKALLDWICQFNNEFYKCVFSKKHKNILRGQKRRRERYNAEKARQRDAISGGFSVSYFDMDAISVESPEDAIIALIDLKREKERAKKQ